MIHVDILTHEEAQIELHLFSDLNGDILDIWVFDAASDEDEFKGHLTLEMFKILMEEDLGTNRNSIFAAVTTCDTHSDA